MKYSEPGSIAHDIEKLGKYSKFYKDHHETLGHKVIFTQRCQICKKPFIMDCWKGSCMEEIEKRLILSSTSPIIYCLYCKEWGEKMDDLKFKLWKDGGRIYEY